MIKLITPKLENLNYREMLLADKATMAFNAGSKLNMDNYCYNTGCVFFTKDR